MSNTVIRWIEVTHCRGRLTTVIIDPGEGPDPAERRRDQHPSGLGGSAAGRHDVATLRIAEASLAGRVRGIRSVTPFLGPAFVAAIAYVDPGNFATNIAAGSQFGYQLLWVVLAANLIAILIQTMTSRLGIATGRTLPQLARARYPRWLNFLLWVQAEVVAMATDIAELIGAALALHLLFGIPLLPAGLIAAGLSFVILGLQRTGFRRLELMIGGMLLVVLACFVYLTIKAQPDPVQAALGFVTPRLDGQASLLLAVGIMGATVMPHVVYLHSSLTSGRIAPRSAADRRLLVRHNRRDVVIALSIAGVVNASMLAMAAAAFHEQGLSVESIEEAYASLGATLGGGAAIAFGVALLAAGVAATIVGTMSGQVVMQGFMGWRIPIVARRLVTMLPGLAVLAVGIDTTTALVISQVVLSFGIPFALIPLILLGRDRQLMGDLTNPRYLTIAASIVAAGVIALNAALLILQIGGG